MLSPCERIASEARTLLASRRPTRASVRLPNSPAWLVLVLEPEPGAPPDTAREDEEHHRLISGDMLHVSTWVRPILTAENRRLAQDLIHAKTPAVNIGEPVMEFFDPTQPRQTASSIVAKARKLDEVTAS